MSELEDSKLIFFQYKKSVFKVKTNNSKTTLRQLLKQKFPEKNFPIDTIFVEKSSKNRINDLRNSKNGEVVLVLPPEPNALTDSPQSERPVAYVSGFDPNTSIHCIKLLLGLDESVSDKNLLVRDYFEKDCMERGIFIELSNDLQLAGTLKMDGYEAGIWKLSVKKLEGKCLMRYLREKRKSQVVKVGNIHEDVIQADLRILFSNIPIHSVHLLRDRTAYIELGEDHVEIIKKYNGEIYVGKQIYVKESTSKKMLKAIRQSIRSIPQEMPTREMSENKFSAESERDQIQSRIEQTVQNGLRETAKPEVEPKPVYYENKDFKCVHVVNLPPGSSDLDLARFFDDVQIQPLMIHKKIDGTEAFCEFPSVRSCDKAVTLNNEKIGQNIVEVIRVKYIAIQQMKMTNSGFILDEKDLNSYIVKPEASNQSFLEEKLQIKTEPYSDVIKTNISGEKRKSRKKKKKRKRSKTIESVAQSSASPVKMELLPQNSEFAGFESTNQTTANNLNPFSQNKIPQQQYQQNHLQTNTQQNYAQTNQQQSFSQRAQQQNVQQPIAHRQNAHQQNAHQQNAHQQNAHQQNAHQQNVHQRYSQPPQRPQPQMPQQTQNTQRQSQMAQRPQVPQRPQPQLQNRQLNQAQNFGQQSRQYQPQAYGQSYDMYYQQQQNANNTQNLQRTQQQYPFRHNLASQQLGVQAYSSSQLKGVQAMARK